MGYLKTLSDEYSGELVTYDSRYFKAYRGRLHFNGKVEKNIPQPSGLKSFKYLFENCSNTDLDLSDWDVSGVDDFSLMFKNCYNLKRLNLSTWKVKPTANFNNMFVYCNKLEQKYKRD